MAKPIYRIVTDAGVMYASVDLTEASSSIYTYFGSDPLYEDRGEDTDEEGLRWAPTPYQTADAQHREGRMAELVAGYCDMGDVVRVALVERGE